jgi:hypothetical protein
MKLLEKHIFADTQPKTTYLLDQCCGVNGLHGRRHNGGQLLQDTGRQPAGTTWVSTYMLCLRQEELLQM